MPKRKSRLKTVRNGPTTSTTLRRSEKACNVSSPTTTSLAPQESTSRAPSGRWVPASTSRASGKAGMKLGQLANERSLHRSTLNRVEVGDIACVNAEGRVERSKHGDGIAYSPRHQLRLQRRIARPITGLRMHGDTTAISNTGMICIRDPDPLQAYMIGEPAILGWDIGGVNLKAARLARPRRPHPSRASSHPFEIQHSLGSLPSALRWPPQLEGEPATGMP